MRIAILGCRRCCVSSAPTPRPRTTLRTPRAPQALSSSPLNLTVCLSTITQLGVRFGLRGGNRILRSEPKPVSLLRHPSKSSFLVMEATRSSGEHLEENEHGVPHFRLIDVGGFKTEILEIVSKKPETHVYIIPGNPGIVAYYKDYIMHLHKLMGGNASITAISHVAHTLEDHEAGKTFSLADQIAHKVEFFKQILHPDPSSNETTSHEFESSSPSKGIILVGHSIGAYMCLEVLKLYPERISLVIGLYPFIKVNEKSSLQNRLNFAAHSSFFRFFASSFASAVGILPSSHTNALVRSSIGKSWSPNSVETTQRYMLNFRMIQNYIFMGMTEFDALIKDLDSDFMNANSGKICFIFGEDDHWGPLHHRDEIVEKAPNVRVFLEEEGHLHAFCCTLEGSAWVAEKTANLVSDACIQNS